MRYSSTELSTCGAENKDRITKRKEAQHVNHQTRTWIAISLGLGIWLAYLQWFSPPPNALPEQNLPKSASQVLSEGTPKVGSETNEKRGEIQAQAFVENPLLDPQIADSGSPRSILENQDVSIAITSRGRLSDIKMKSFRETMQKNAQPIALAASERSAAWFATLFTHPALRDLAFAPVQEEEKKVATKPELGTQWRGVARSHGLVLSRTYSLAPNGYFLQWNLEMDLSPLVASNPKATDWGEMLIPLGQKNLDENSAHPLTSWEVVLRQNESLTRQSAAKIATDPETHVGNTEWLAFGNRYFSSVLINESPLNPDALFWRSTGFTGAYLRYPLHLKPGQKSLSFAWRVFIGPKEVSQFSQHPNLKQLIDYGVFSVLAYPLLWVLRFLNQFIHNYGWSIIVLTLLVRILFYPLSVKTYQSMKAMQKLQPQLAVLRERYKNDRESLNREQMALFKTHHVNPLGSCLPTLIPMPVFFALYSVLGTSVELFHAPFGLWIHDLASKDPFYVLPILMGSSLFLQQKFTPQTGLDPAQARMMFIMPLVLTGVMINLASGLALYMFVSTLLGILQQMFINRQHS